MNRTSNWTKELGTYADTPKNQTSYRSIKLNDDVIALLLKFREYQYRQKTELGDKWVENDRLFTRWNGLPMTMNSPHIWFEKYCAKHGLRYLNIHSFRHTHALLLIHGGVDIKTVQAALGHSSANTPLGIYCHAFQTSQVRAMEVITNAMKAES